jgi:hypothetical protein
MAHAPAGPHAEREVDEQADERALPGTAGMLGRPVDARAPEHAAVRLGVANPVLLGRGQRNGAKVLFGVWLGLLIPALFVLWFLGVMVAMI